MYGFGGDKPKKEDDFTDPLTAYARSKIGVENKLKTILSNSTMKLIFLRFATACGSSDRLRLDLVLNDFVASAIKYKELSILSDGSPWRPLIDVKDMAKAIIWAIEAKFEDSLPLSLNIGSNEWNFNILELAQSVANHIGGTRINLNQNAPKDNRSYKVDFSLYKSLCGSFYPSESIDHSIDNLAKIIYDIDLPENGFRQTKYIRLNHIKNLISRKSINNNLRWI
jgi:UDP-glucose 4-epimerase